MRESERLSQIPLAGIREVFEKAKELEAGGRDIVHLEIGRPDFDTPEAIKEAASTALDRGFVHYTSNFGIDELRQAVADKLKKENGIDLSYEGIIITGGASMALATAIFGLLDPGDEILIPTPAYPAYRKQARLAEAHPVPVPLKYESGFSLEVEELERRSGENTKMLVLNSPHNPTGTALSRENLERIAEFARRQDIYVLADECYEKILFGRTEHHSIASLPGMQERTLTVNSTSKSYAMTGWRVGFIAGPPQIISSLIKVPQNISICATSFAQIGALRAYRKNDEELIGDMIEEINRRRQLVVEALNRIDLLEFIPPGGALYVFPRITDTELDSQQVSDYLLEEAGVAVTPGDDFGRAGRGFIRIALTTDFDRLQMAMDRIGSALDKWS
ncbi:pyridoxal phosphate-dependent aminotransferase [Halarsenatibacter silvermanii]|uniref:Aminotransferase n=1 Tax=Halarsenatibacter silvermanii TaxID=321763 RepID=A0A1G9MUN5_9FIRM|nr:pyridoxal phosphate-dependent aminotransferase [Halarsenatibacter silvermanii]SDL77345.1 aromatic amino acid aminotransferase apoenzyme [Halarsenatibacter silvermanii]